MDSSSIGDSVYSCFSSLVTMAWGLYSLWVVSKILRATYSVWKKDWFWFPMKAGYYIGLGLGLLWAIVAMLVAGLFPQFGLVPVLIIQVLVAFISLQGESTSEIEELVWYAMPFFALPFWLAYRQGQKEGTFPGPNPPFNPDPTAGS